MNLDQFTNKNTYSNILSKITSTNTTTFNINGTSIPVVDKKVIPTTEDAASLLKSSNQTVNVLNYYAPSKVVLDTFSELGKNIDKSLQSSFLLQTFHIKGTDILCAMFCFMVSLLPCSERNALYNTVYNINKGTQALASGARGVKGMVDTFNATMSTAPSLANTINDIFKKPSETNKGTTSDLAKNASTLIAVPTSLVNNAKLIINAMKFGMNFKFMMPNFTGKGIWDLSQNVLFALQGMAVQAADEALRKVIKPVEDMINNIYPSICYNNMAERVRINLIETINTLKSRILMEIASLFDSNNGFNISFRKINVQAGWALELVAFMDALDYLSSNFYMIAKGCGLSPCGNTIPDVYQSSDIGNLDVAYSNDNVNPFVSQPPTPPVIASLELAAPTAKNIDEVVDKFKDFMSPSNIQIDDNSIKSVYNLNNNAPEQIKEFISSGLLNNILDHNYTVDTKTATVMYNYDKKCGQ